MVMKGEYRIIDKWKGLKNKTRVWYHVIGGDEGIVNRNEFDIVPLQSHSGYQTPNPSKSCKQTNIKIEQWLEEEKKT